MSSVLPRVSVIIPAHNSEKWIAEAIQSVLNQSYQFWELIIVNDNSTDRTEQLVSEFIEKDDRVKLLNLYEKSGVSFVRNHAVSHARGEFIAFLDSDDLWMPEKLTKQISFHDKNPTCKFSHTDYSIFNEKGIIRTPYKFIFTKFIQKKGNLLKQLLYLNPIGILTVMVEKKTFIDNKGFDVNQWGMEDHDLWLRISNTGCEFSYIPNELSSYRINQTGMMNSYGKYKHTYKTFLKKNNVLMSRHNVLYISNAYYYRYFGITNFKLGNYKVAILYFSKALYCYKGIYFQFVTLPYLIISYLRGFIFSLKTT